jgi:hypothetical protein
MVSGLARRSSATSRLGWRIAARTLATSAPSVAVIEPGLASLTQCAAVSTHSLVSAVPLQLPPLIATSAR